MDTPSLSPLSNEQASLLHNFSTTLSPLQASWVAGYFAGLTAKQAQLTQVETQQQQQQHKLTILYGSRTGNGEGLAKIAAKMAQEIGITATIKNMADYKGRDLQGEQNLLVIVSTHGEGEPPFAAKEFYDFIHGNRATKLNDVRYAVLALGDSSYFYFCKTGKDVDAQLEKLGATRVLALQTCDVDLSQSEAWLATALQSFVGNDSNMANQPLQTNTSIELSNTQSIYTKTNPFQATVLEKIQLHGAGSDRETIHLELSIPEQGFDYEPGDAAGIIPVNSATLISEFLAETGFNAGEIIQIQDKNKKLEDVLYRDVELSKISVDVLTRYAALIGNKKLSELATQPDLLKEYLEGRDIVDLLIDFPSDLDANSLVRILRPLQPRYYSIASSMQALQGELHLTVGVVKYKHAGRTKKGACSSYLSELTMDYEVVPIFIEKNPEFKLPTNPQTPIIMVGAGTGIAPYRGFVQHRELVENRGKSWLIFGNRNFESEFLYQTEWQDYIQRGVLTKMDVAFSRDGTKKLYVQDKLYENASEVYSWLEQGAHIYICGDRKKMAKDVQQVLLKIIENQASVSSEAAQEYLDNLQKNKRLQMDVY
ncbi:MAG: sulfite reductase [NADPH] flavoprotein, alpha-component [Porphyromonadaceae bacterium CG2_30_38_12]|nr:MAG: sulfite reductase [NADPH] flavoprotein, alpha-component [Porphyromonadaceae bacterium CG2_30_38_12]